MELTEKRMKHCHGVGMKMAEMVRLDPELYGCTPEEAYVLGLLHDFGYQFAENQEDHAHLGAATLRQSGYKYWREVYHHSAWQDEYSSPLLKLLYFADMTVGPAGESVTVRERIDDIEARYGTDSPQYKETVELAGKLGF